MSKCTYSSCGTTSFEERRHPYYSLTQRPSIGRMERRSLCDSFPDTRFVPSTGPNGDNDDGDHFLRLRRVACVPRSWEDDDENESRRKTSSRTKDLNIGRGDDGVSCSR